MLTRNCYGTLLVLKFGTVYHLRSGLDFRPFQTMTEYLCVYTGVMKSQRLVTVVFWRYINPLYVCIYVDKDYSSGTRTSLSRIRTMMGTLFMFNPGVLDGKD